MSSFYSIKDRASTFQSILCTKRIKKRSCVKMGKQLELKSVCEGTVCVCTFIEHYQRPSRTCICYNYTHNRIISCLYQLFTMTLNVSRIYCTRSKVGNVEMWMLTLVL
ncbi:hypothetical protein FKM82_002133 [Ascaphus truei]